MGILTERARASLFNSVSLSGFKIENEVAEFIMRRRSVFSKYALVNNLALASRAGIIIEDFNAVSDAVFTGFTPSSRTQFKCALYFGDGASLDVAEWSARCNGWVKPNPELAFDLLFGFRSTYFSVLGLKDIIIPSEIEYRLGFWLDGDENVEATYEYSDEKKSGIFRISNNDDFDCLRFGIAERPEEIIERHQAVLFEVPD